MTSFDSNVPIDSRVGFAVETTEGTAEAEPDFELFMLPGNAPEASDVEDGQFIKKAFNKPYSQGAIKTRWHSEGSLPGLLFAPGNGFPELLEVAFGSDFYSKQVYTLAVQDGTKFSRGNLVFGKTSLARGEVAKIVSNTLYLIGVQGTFQNAEDLLDKPGGVDYSTNAAGASAAVSGYYCHKLDGVKYQANVSTVKVNTVATKAVIADYMVDFSKYGVSSGDRNVILTAKDEDSVPISGWLGAPCICVEYDGGTGAFTAGKTLSAQTGANPVRVIGTIIAVVGNTTAGYIFAEQSATATAILDEDTLTDDSTGAATANMTTIPAYLNNACKVYSDFSGSTQSWNGDVTTFDETETLTYEAIQGRFDQKSMTTFFKDAGDNTIVINGTKIRSLNLNVNHTDFTFGVELIGRTLGYASSEPAWPGVLSAERTPFGASSRTLEIDGSTSGQTAYVLDFNIAYNCGFNTDRVVPLNSNYPNWLQPTDWAIVGTTRLQWRDNTIRKEAWGGSSVTTVTAGSKVTKRLFMSLDSGEEVVTGYNYEIDIGVMGTVNAATLDRNEAGYVQPVTLEGIMQASGYEWSPVQFYIYDGSATH